MARHDLYVKFLALNFINIFGREELHAHGGFPTNES